MKTTYLNSHYRPGGLILLLASLVVAACTMPTKQLTAAPTDTLTGVTEASPTQTPAEGWKIFQNTQYGFMLSYPDQGLLKESAAQQGTRIDLPIEPGTNLQEKYAQIDVQENPEVCGSPLAQGYEAEALQAEQVTFQGVDFLTTSGEEGAAGNTYEWTAYSTSRNGICVSVSFVLHATNPFNYPTPPPEFDRSSETGVFSEIMATFSWTR